MLACGCSALCMCSTCGCCCVCEHRSFLEGETWYWKCPDGTVKYAYPEGERGVRQVIVQKESPDAL